MMTWAVIAMVAGLAWVVYGPVLRRSSSARTLHFRNGVCEENEIGVWKYLRHLGLRRELGEGAVAGGARQSTDGRVRSLSATASRRVLLDGLPDLGTEPPAVRDSRRARGLLVQIRGHRDCSGRRGPNSVLNPSERIAARRILLQPDGLAGLEWLCRICVTRPDRLSGLADPSAPIARRDDPDGCYCSDHAA